MKKVCKYTGKQMKKEVKMGLTEKGNCDNLYAVSDN